MTAPPFDDDNGNGGSGRHHHAARRRRHPTPAKTALQDRLQEIVVFELTQDGRREYRTMTLRALYNYVLRAIADRPAALQQQQQQQNVSTPQGGGGGGGGALGNMGSADVGPSQRYLQRYGSSPGGVASFSSWPAPTMRRLRAGSVGMAPGALGGSAPILPTPPEAPPPTPPIFSLSPDAPTADAASGLSRDAESCPSTTTGTLRPTVLSGLTSASTSTSTSTSSGLPPLPRSALHTRSSSEQPTESNSGSLDGGSSSSQQRVSFSTMPATPSWRPLAPPPPPPVPPLPVQQQQQPQQQPHLQPPTMQPITYRERLGGYLHPRDMRRLVTPFSATNEPELIVRRHVVLLNFDPLRAIVLRDRLLVLVPDGADSILIALERRVRGGVAELENQVFGDDELVEGGGSGHGGSGSSGGSGMQYTEHGTARTSFRGPVVVDVDPTGETVAFVGMDSPWDNLDKNQGGEESNGNVEMAARQPMRKVKDDEGDEAGITETNTDDTTPDSAVDGDGDGDDADFFLNDEDDEWEDLNTRQWIDMPFELQAIDAVLQTVSAMLSDDAAQVRRRVHVAMDALRGDSRKSSAPGEHAQEKLRLHKDEVNVMEKRVQGFVRAINQVLDEDEDMALMNLSRLLTHPERFIQPVLPEVLHEESDEPELILEAYLQHALSTVNALELLKGQILSTEELVNMTLDTIRNRLLYINTLLSLASLCVAAASLVGSIFGMNLKNKIEEDENAFRQVVIGTLVGSFCLLVVLSYLFYRANMVPTAKAKDL